MSKPSLREQQFAFMEGLWNFRAKGEFEVYHYAVFERLRSSIEEDYPRLMEELDRRGESRTRFIQELLHFVPPASWTLAEAGSGVRAFLLSVDDIEALRFAELDEAENEAAWCEDWPEAPGIPEEKFRAFSEGRLRVVRTKTWRVEGGTVFWRGTEGLSEQEGLPPLLELFTRPMDISELEKVCEHAELSPTEVTDLLRDGIARGWLVLTPNGRPRKYRK